MLYKPERIGGKISLKITVGFFLLLAFKKHGVVSDIILAQVLNCHCSFLRGGITHAI